MQAELEQRVAGVELFAKIDKVLVKSKSIMVLGDPMTSWGKIPLILALINASATHTVVEPVLCAIVDIDSRLR